MGISGHITGPGSILRTVLRPRNGGISQDYRHAISLTRRSLLLPFGHTRTLLRGWQLHGFPTTSLRSRRYMEVPRHILAQMVVAGTHMVPFGSGIPYFGAGSSVAAGVGPQVHGFRPGPSEPASTPGISWGDASPSAPASAQKPNLGPSAADLFRSAPARPSNPLFPAASPAGQPPEDQSDPLGWLVDLMNPNKR